MKSRLAKNLASRIFQNMFGAAVAIVAVTAVESVHASDLPTSLPDSPSGAPAPASALLQTSPTTTANQAAAPAPSSGAKPVADSKTKKKSTEVSFDDVLVQGKYHFTDEAVTTVEEDKVLDALLGVRTEFKDRLKKSSARH